MDDIQHSSSPKSKLASSHWLRCMCCVLETNLTRKFAMDIFCKSFNSLHLSVRLWWNMLDANLAINFQDLVAKVKSLVTLVLVLGAILCPELNMQIIIWLSLSYFIYGGKWFFTVKTAFFSCWNRVFSHANNLTSLWYLSCKGAVKKRVDRVAAPYLEVLETSLYGVSTVFRW